MWIHLQSCFNKLRVKQAVIDHQCQKYQRQGRDVNNTRQESGQAATQSGLQGAISQGQAAENQWGKQSRVIHGKVTETGIISRGKTNLRNECEGCLSRAVNEEHLCR